MNGQRIGIVALQSQTSHTAEFTRESIANHRNNANSTQSNQWESNTIIPRNHIKVFRFVLDDIIHLGNISRRLLNGYNIIKITRQTQSSLSGHIHARTSRYIIKNNGEVG